MSSSLSPLAMWFSSSMWLRRTLAVDQAWVRLKPFFLSSNLASRSPEMAPDLVSRIPRTLKVTPEGVLVLTSRVEPWMGLCSEIDVEGGWG